MERATDIAYRMLQIAKINDTELSNLQLQKLVYIAHGYLLGWKGKPLISDKVYAWKFGPVINSIYHQFKKYGADKIPTTDSIESLVFDFDEDTEKALNGVFNLYKNDEAEELVEITHRDGTPWDIVWNHQDGNKRLFAEIDNELIKDHYRKVITNPEEVSGL